jgi:aminobenzoyl-glutamate utilization protein B
MDGFKPLPGDEMADTFMADIKQSILALADGYGELVADVATTIWEYAEIGRHELRSARYLADILEAQGFSVQRGVGGYPTGFIAEYATGPGPTFGLLCEYDALPGLSTTVPGGAGHGCGHNLFAAGAIGTALVLRDFAAAEGLGLKIKVFGTPSEEGYSSKPFYARQGLFAGVDCFMGFHPLEFNGVLYARHNAILSCNYRFHGIASHAGAEPELGASALDAVELMNVAANYLREHVTQDVRIHYIITDGGKAANVVPDFASSHYMVRAQEFENLARVHERLNTIARAAAMATGCTAEIEPVEGFANTVLNRPLAELAQANLQWLGPPPFDAADDQRVRQLGLTGALSRTIRPLPEQPGAYTASTDEGDVSWLGPWIRICMATLAEGTPGHSPAVTHQARLPAAFKGMVQTVKVCACTLADLLLLPESLARVQDYHRDAVAGRQMPVFGNVWPDPLRFPEAPGVRPCGDSSIEVVPQETILLAGTSGQAGTVIRVYAVEGLIGQANLAGAGLPLTIPLQRRLVPGDILALAYQRAGDKKPGRDDIQSEIGPAGSESGSERSKSGAAVPEGGTAALISSHEHLLGYLHASLGR